MAFRESETELRRQIYKAKLSHRNRASVVLLEIRFIRNVCIVPIKLAKVMLLGDESMHVHTYLNFYACLPGSAHRIGPCRMPFVRKLNFV